MSLFNRKNRKKTESVSKSELYDDYRDTRDEVWRVLAENNVSSLPVDVNSICAAGNIDIFSYEHAHVLINSLHIEKRCAENEYVVLLLVDRKIILYDDSVPGNYARFLIASGLGHYELGHVHKNVLTDEGVAVFTAEQNLQAAIFSIRLLAPLSVLWAMGVRDAKEIEKLCRIPKQTALKRAERLAEIDDRNEQRGISMGQGTLFMSGYERASHRQFIEFIESYRFEKY